VTDLALPAPLARKKLTWSHTFLHTYADICPHQAWRRFIKRDIPFVATVASERGIRTHKAMQRRIEGKALPTEFSEFEQFAQPFDGKNAKAEIKLGMTMQGASTGFFAEDTWGNGVLDVLLLDVSTGYKGPKTAFLADWKTGKSKYESPFELEVHAVLLHAKYPTLTKIVGQYIYLGENKISQMYELSHTTRTWARIGAIMSEVEADLKAGHFEKREGPLCGWCSVKDCQHNKNRGV
jgi:hypothetical protein